MSQPIATPQRLQPLVALRAIRRLIADPEQTHEVFTIIRALSGAALHRGFMRFADTEYGRKVLRDEIDLLDTLKDRASLAALPTDTLGHHYLNFVTSEDLSADGLVDASQSGEIDQLQGDIARFATRQRDMHDLWHALTDYGRDTLGELCLLCFTYAQTRHRGIGFICLAGAKRLATDYGPGVYRAAWNAYRDGKHAAWLPAQNWEELVAEPMEEVRRKMNIRPSQDYIALRTNYAPA